MTGYTLCAPLYRLSGIEHALSTCPDVPARFTDARFEVHEQIQPLSDRLLRVQRTWRNISGSTLEFQPIFEVKTAFAAEFTLIPCVSVNGNAWGSGKEPKGLALDGKPWVFAANRCAIPACTLSENTDTVFALFAAPEDEASLVSSCSLHREADGTMRHRIWYPYVEEPLSYISRDLYGPAHQNHIRLAPGETFSASICCFICAPRWPFFGTAALEDEYLTRFPMEKQPARDAESLWTLGVAYAKALCVCDHPGRRVLGIGYSWDEQAGSFTLNPHAEIGWCGQNAAYARMLIRDYMRHGHEDSLSLALDVLDAWAEDTVFPTGLLCVHYEKKDAPDGPVSDTCNLGFAARELLLSYRLLKEIGIDKPRYLQSARGICDFFTRERDGSTGFGKAWNCKSGQCVSDEGTVGAYLIPALVEMHRECGDARYLDTARRAFAFYMARDLDRFMCTAGALDTDCIDKETSGALLIGGLMLYEQTDDEEYLIAAQKAGYYFCSFMYHYDVPYPPQADFSVHSFTTYGTTAVSVQHHHVDAWGVFLVPWFLKLASMTGDSLWEKRARALWSSFTYGIAGPEDRYAHGRMRPIGSQNEGWMHCRWCSREQHVAGTMNDWLVAWPGAYRLLTIDALMSAPAANEAFLRFMMKA